MLCSTRSVRSGSRTFFDPALIAFLLWLPAPVCNAQPFQLAFTVQPANATAGTAIAPALEVSILDDRGRLERNATNAVTLSILANPGGSTLSGTATATPVNGVARFTNISLDRSGAGYALTATSPGLQSATSALFAVFAGPAARLRFVAQPTSAQAGVSFSPSPRVEVQDTYGNLVTTASNAITLSLSPNPTGATLGGTTTRNAATGTVDFADVRVARAGSGYGLTAAAPGLTSANSGLFDIARGAPNRLLFLDTPSDAVAGTVLTPTSRVAITDAYDNVIPTANNVVVQVTMAANPLGARLMGSGYEGALSVNGIATLPALRGDRSGTGFVLRAFTDNLVDGNVLLEGTSGPFNLTGGTATSFDLSSWSSVSAGQNFPQFEARFLNANGAIVSEHPVTPVTVSLDPQPADVALNGTLSANSANGIAKFLDLNITKVGNYRVKAVSNAFTVFRNISVYPAAPAKLTVRMTSPPYAEWDQLLVTVLFRDAYDNDTTAVPFSARQVTLSVTDFPTGTAPVAPTTKFFPFAGGWGGGGYYGPLGFTLQLERGSGYTLQASAGSFVSEKTLPFSVILRFKTVSAGGSHTCGLSIASRIYCWGNNNTGTLGTGNYVTSYKPAVVNPAQRWEFVNTSLASAHTCGLTLTSVLPYCWGYKFQSVGAVLSNAPVEIPRETGANPPTVNPGSQIAAGQTHACLAWSKSSSPYRQDVLCWGVNSGGKTGIGTTEGTLAKATRTLVPAASYIGVTTGAFHTCALSESKDGYCWGSNNDRQVDPTVTTGGISRISTPRLIPGGKKWKQLSAGSRHTCGIDDATSAVHCWGSNENGQLGSLNTTLKQYQIPGFTFAHVSAGSNHTCGITSSAAIYCWGENKEGQLGVGVAGAPSVPVFAAPVGVTFKYVSAGIRHTCAISQGDEVYCWGQNTYGQLGTGDVSNKSTPTKIIH